MIQKISRIFLLRKKPQWLSVKKFVKNVVILIKDAQREKQRMTSDKAMEKVKPKKKERKCSGSTDDFSRDDLRFLKTRRVVSSALFQLQTETNS